MRHIFPDAMNYGRAYWTSGDSLFRMYEESISDALTIDGFMFTETHIKKAWQSIFYGMRVGMDKIIRQLGYGDISSIVDMLDSCGPLKFAKSDSPNTLALYLSKGFMIKGVFVGEELAGYAVVSIRIGESFKKLFAKYNFITDRDTWEHAGILNNCVIRDKYRGRGYQLELLKEREEVIWNFGLKEMYTSVHALNTYSINNLVKAGYKQIGQHVIKKDWILFGKRLDGASLL